ncbi:MAG TPA: DUF5994 family protein [Acidothermaceae bacterium]|jgi:hypothetical protein
MTTLFDPDSVPALVAQASSSALGLVSSGGGRRDAWHPISWDIGQVAIFAVALSAELGAPVERITLNPASWSDHPRLLPLPDGRRLRVDWFEAAPLDEVSVRRRYESRLTIRLVPSSWAAAPVLERL